MLNRVSKIERADVQFLLLLSALWLLPALWIGVAGNFPLNDDWAHARVVWRWLETGEFERLRWTWVPLLSNVGWGALFTSLLGRGFVSLRISSLAAGWLGVVGSYALARRLGAPPARAALAGGIVALNPLYLNLSFTFMTDVAFTAASVWAFYALVRSRMERKWLWLAVGLALAALAAGSRQPGLAIPIGFAGVMLWEHRRRWRQLLLWGALALAALAPFLLYDSALEAGEQRRLVTPRLFLRDMLLQRDAPHDLVHNALFASMYLGWFLAPVAVLRAWTRTTSICGLVGVLAGIGGMAYFGDSLPLGLNVIYDLGLGPIGMASDPVSSGVPGWLWWGLAALGFFAFFHLLASVLLELSERHREVETTRAVVLLTLICGLYLLVLGVRGLFFDRYLLFVLPAFAAIAVRTAGTVPLRRKIACAVAALLLAGFGIVGTRDYMVHMRTRQAVLDELTGRGIPPEQVDGGFEFNGLHRPAWASYSEDFRHLSPRGVRYVITLRFGESCDAEAHTYRRLLPSRLECVAVVETDRASWLPAGELPYDTPSGSQAPRERP